MRSYKRVWKYFTYGETGIVDMNQFAATQIEAQQLSAVPDQVVPWWILMPDKDQLIQFLNLYYSKTNPPRTPDQAPFAFEISLEDPWPLN